MGRRGVRLSANFAQACVCLGVGCHSLHAHYRLVYSILKIPENNAKTNVTDSDQLSYKILDPKIRIQVFKVQSNFEKDPIWTSEKSFNLLN